MLLIVLLSLFTPNHSTTIFCSLRDNLNGWTIGGTNSSFLKFITTPNITSHFCPNNSYTGCAKFHLNNFIEHTFDATSFSDISITYDIKTGPNGYDDDFEYFHVGYNCDNTNYIYTNKIGKVETVIDNITLLNNQLILPNTCNNQNNIKIKFEQLCSYEEIYLNNVCINIVGTTLQPTKIPTNIPTIMPTTNIPTMVPTKIPTTGIPTLMPSKNTEVPTIFPTIIPTVFPTKIPTTNIPTMYPTVLPAYTPTMIPTKIPTYLPTINPSIVPTILPTVILTTIETTIVENGKSNGLLDKIKGLMLIIIILGLSVLCLLIIVCIVMIIIYYKVKKTKKISKKINDSGNNNVVVSASDVNGDVVQASFDDNIHMPNSDTNRKDIEMVFNNSKSDNENDCNTVINDEGVTIGDTGNMESDYVVEGNESSEDDPDIIEVGHTITG